VNQQPARRGDRDARVRNPTARQGYPFGHLGVHSAHRLHIVGDAGSLAAHSRSRQDRLATDQAVRARRQVAQIDAQFGGQFPHRRLGLRTSDIGCSPALVQWLIGPVSD